MASDESRPGSSASTSTSSSEQFENGSQSQSSSRRSRSNSANSNSSSSRDNSPGSQAVDLKIGPQSPAQNESDGQENNDSQSRSISRASNQSDGSINSSENDGNESQQSGQNSNLSGMQQGSRSQSASPPQQLHSRNSSVSSVPDAVNSSAEQSRHDAINISHEDLSDVSDLESATASPADNDDKEEEQETEEKITDGKAEPIIDLRQKINERKQEGKQNKEGNKNSPSIVDELNDIMDKKHDEDALDFEAEDGECEEKEPQAPAKGEKEAVAAPKKPDSDGEINDNDELEEGEVSDEDEKRPEETEPKPVCRFYTRGQCTWGMSCRFLHPGVTDKGNYTMFDMIRPVPVNAHAPPYGPGGVVPVYHDFRSERPPMHHPMHGFGNGGPPQARPPIAEPVVESAWERGLRTAKEMMRKANKRKEQDMDFEDKKMNLSASQDEIEKDNYYIRERSPEIASPPFGVRPGMHHPAMGGYSPPPRVGMPPRGAPMPFEHDDPYNRSLRYRELPPHRMPQYEDEIHRQKMRPAREVIVQRVEPVGRGDEWNDPWMRSKSPVREKRTKRRSYSSNSSYSSSSDSSSKTGSSSNSSRSPSPNTRRRRYSSTRASSHKSPVRGRHLKGSPTPELHKRRVAHSPVQMHPMNNKEAHFEAKKDLRNHPTLSKRANPNIVGRRSSPPKKQRQPTPPIVDKRVTRSPLTKRKRASPPAPPPRKPISFSLPKSNNLQKRKRSSSSGSGSSGSSGSESDSSDSSSSSGSSNDGHKARTRDKVVSERSKMANKKVEATRKRSPPISSSQNKAQIDGTIISSSKSGSSASVASSKKSTRREELLKQLRAVEDAIARKRSKLS